MRAAPKRRFLAAKCASSGRTLLLLTVAPRLGINRKHSSTAGGEAAMSNILEFRRKRSVCKGSPPAAAVSCAQAVWRGDARGGCGAIAVASAEPAERAYSFMASLASGNGTNPAELLAAAHASCFTQSLTLVLQAAGYTPTELSTQAVVTLESDGAGVRGAQGARKDTESDPRCI